MRVRGKLLLILLALLLLASCASAEPWVPDETPAAREARILATAESFEYEIDEVHSFNRYDTLKVGYLLLQLTAREAERSEVFGGAFIDEVGSRFVVYTTKDVWSGAPPGGRSQGYYLDRIFEQIPIDIALCDFTLSELGATARELEAANLAGVLDIRVEPEHNRVAVYAGSWDEKKQAELEKSLAHPEHCAVTTAAPPDADTVAFVERSTQWETTDAMPAATMSQSFSVTCRAAERLHNAWWYLPAGSWQQLACDLDAEHPYESMHANTRYHAQADAGYYPSVDAYRLGYDGTPIWEAWGAEQEAFFRHLLAGLEITVCYNDEGRNVIVV